MKHRFWVPLFLCCKWYYLAKFFLFEREILELECLGFQCNLLTLAVLKRIHQQRAAESQACFLSAGFGDDKGLSFALVLYLSCRFLSHCHHSHGSAVNLTVVTFFFFSVTASMPLLGVICSVEDTFKPFFQFNISRSDLLILWRGEGAELTSFKEYQVGAQG